MKVEIFLEGNWNLSAKSKTYGSLKERMKFERYCCSDKWKKDLPQGDQESFNQDSEWQKEQC